MIVDGLDVKTGVFNGGNGIAVQVAPGADSLPQRGRQVLHAREQPVVNSDVLDQTKLTTRLDDSPHLLERARRIGDRAKDEGP